MKSRDEFVDRFKRHVAGMALFGVASENRDGPLSRAAKVLDIPGEVEKLLGQMYDWVTAPNGHANGHTNGHAGAVLPKPLGKG